MSFRPSRVTRARRATRTVLVLVLAATFLGSVVGDPANAATSTLTAGHALGVDGTLASPSGEYRLVLQDDGNLVLYTSSAQPLWSTRTAGAHAAALVLQGDGNLVLYSASGAALWNSRTNGSGAASLVLQDDGNLVLYAPRGAVWSSNTSRTPSPPSGPRSIGDRLAPGGTLTATAYLTSASGQYTLRITAGQLVLSTASTSLWASPNTGPGTFASLQADGNLVVYGSTGALWSTGTQGTGANLLAVQDDGNVVLYSPRGPVWSTGTAAVPPPPAGTDRLLPLQGLRAGESLVSTGGRYALAMQADGNLVIYGPSGPTWWTSSRGWPGVHAVLQADGNFVLYSGAGVALWSTGTTTGSLLVMQTDGNLVLYGPSGAVWSSRYSPRPPVLFPPVVAPPPTATSHYLRGLHGGSSDIPTMTAMGCADGRGNPGGTRYIVFLAYGAQANDVAGSWGVQLTASTLTLTDAAVAATADAYIDGYTSCMAADSWVTVAVGTNNDGGDAGLGTTGGQVWAQQIINPIAAHAAGRQVTVAAANDIEPGFNGSASQAQAWMSGFLGASSAPFVWTGSADGCPQSGPSNAACNYGWTPRQLFDLAYGLSAGRSLPLPQIYYTSQARQWVNISQVGQLQAGRAAVYAGPLTEVAACAQAKSCYSMGAVDAWNTFWSLLSATTATRQAELTYTTDLRIDY